MNFEDYETLPTNNVSTHMMAGAFAGVMEHCVMYPLDSVKTRMQSLSPANAPYRGIAEALHRMVVHEGVLRPVRGIGAVVVSAGPAHSLYFSCYEYLKDSLAHRMNPHIAHGAAGCVATVLHDGIMTPADVVKQRMQMYNSPYKSLSECILRLYRTEGLRAFYRSYTTTLAMNIPFQSIHFMVYEMAQSLTNPDRVYNPAAHMMSGAVAGGLAAAITTPLDVCKTLLNTQQTGARVYGMMNAIKMVYTLGGPLGYFKGISARVLYQMPSTAICWSTYEFFKYFLTSRGLISDSHSDSADRNEIEPTIPKSSFGSSSLSDNRPSVSGLSVGVARELPFLSGTGIQGALSLTTVHTADSTHASSSLLDITHS
ncbi:mitoferrin-1 [Nilaparvata lugens]|uniref:mitoferrin-1 n=1 Tax=Nilaparvata lugens TaxID=108931 RepID=UPI00193D8F25|nr:mitoferrin-1 [Nilaparvata lugens]